MKGTDPLYSPWQFAFFRIAFGVYLTVHFLMLLPDAAEIYSRAGVLPDPSLNFTYPLTALNPLAVWNTPVVAVCFVLICLILAILFTAGWRREWAAVALWLGWACLFNRNNLTSNPSIPYVGLLLLLTALVPPGEPLRLDRRTNAAWAMPLGALAAAWALLAVGYTFSGWTKFAGPSWVDGSAMHHLLENPLARPGFTRDLLLLLPGFVLIGMTWSVLVAELMFLPACIFRWGRAAMWGTLLLMHLGIVVVIDFADLSFGMVMVHLFTFDPRWLPQRRRVDRPIVLYDGECGLCSHALSFVAEEDRANALSVASLQGKTGRRLMEACGIAPDQRDTMVVVENGHAMTRSDAALRVAWHLGGIWRLVAVLRWIPRAIRDASYDFVAQRRQAWFGMTCVMPSEVLRRKLTEHD